MTSTTEMDFKQHDQPLPRIRRLCFVGPMTGRNSGLVTTQGEILSDMFACAGYPVISVSALRNRYWRLVDIVTTLVRKRKSIDLVMLQVYGGPSFVVEDIASWLGSHLGHRIIMTLHGGAMPSFMGRFPRWSRRVLGRADALIAPSEYLARAVTAYGFRARVIPNIIQLSAYQYRHRQQVRPRMLWMRSFDPDYNPTMAVRVLALLRNRAPDATLVMAGPDGGLEPEVRRLARELGLNGAVHFSGFLDMAQKLVQGDAADIFINTNHIDNMPVAVVEACAMGLPVVSTDVGGIPDLLTAGETALLVPDGDSKLMAEAIYRLLNDPGLAGRLSANGRQLAERSSWERARQQWEDVFAELLSRPCARGMRRDAVQDGIAS